MWGKGALTCWLAVTGALGCNGTSDGAHPRLHAPCAGPRDCNGLSCMADLQSEPEDLALFPLLCDEPLAAADAGERCDDEQQCALGVWVLSGSCAARCADSDDCAGGERCQEVFARHGPDALQSLTACVPRVSLPARVEVDSTLLRDALPEGEVEIELPPSDPRSTTLYVLEREDDLWPDTARCRPGLCVQQLGTGDQPARVLFDADADYMQSAPANPVATGDHVQPVVIALPSGMREALSEDGHVVTLYSEAPGDLRLTRVTSAADGMQLDLNVFYLGTLGLQPEGARGPPLVRDALEVVDEILGQADLFIGEVRQIEVPGELPERGTLFPEGDSTQGFEVLRLRFGVLAELPGLFRLSAGAGNSALNVFLVRDIEGRGAGDVQGEAGGIPGPVGMHGTGGSGIAIATDMMAGNADRLGRTLAHEIAHFLGLFHVSEPDGSVRDGLDDTEACRAAQDVDGDGLSSADCEGFGADNLMFWSITDGSALSPGQRALLRASPLLK